MGGVKPFYLARPTETTSISVTGTGCALQCAHCGGHYLYHMTPLSSIHTEAELTTSSCLISGGCNTLGQVEVGPYLDHLATIKGTHRYNFHVGLLGEEAIKDFAPLADVVSFDFLGADSTIKNTLKLDRTVADYIACYKNLRKYCARVAPHICVGLEGGKIVGEYQALKLLQELGLEQLIIIVLIPTKGTEYENCTPPALAEVVEFLATARELLPDIQLTLGCMRPGGAYRRQLDVAAVELGIDGIVNPHPLAVQRVTEMGREIIEKKECCAL